MPRSFDVSVESPAGVDQVHAAFGTEGYWLARCEHFGGNKTLDTLTVDPDGTVTVVVTEDLRHGGLPSILTKVYRGDLNIVSTEVWTPTNGRISGQITVAVSGAPGSGRGTAEVAPSGNGSRLSLTGSVQFKVPLVGGTIEGFVAREFADGIAEIQHFTSSWIDDHA